MLLAPGREPPWRGACMRTRLTSPASALRLLGFATRLPSSARHSICPRTLKAAPAARRQARARERGVAHCRLRIRDFDPFDLRLRLPEAVALVAAQARGGTVYIHCTAGMATERDVGPSTAGLSIERGFSGKSNRRSTHAACCSLAGKRLPCPASCGVACDVSRGAARCHCTTAQQTQLLMYLSCSCAHLAGSRAPHVSARAHARLGPRSGDGARVHVLVPRHGARRRDRGVHGGAPVQPAHRRHPRRDRGPAAGRRPPHARHDRRAPPRPGYALPGEPRGRHRQRASACRRLPCTCSRLRCKMKYWHAVDK